jgi:uncharacterized protein YciI
MIFNRIVCVLVVVYLSNMQPCSADEPKDYFVFLTTGKTTQGVAPAEIQKKQAAHLENFGRLAKQGSLTAAGPCSDPQKITRGIVVIKADSIANAESMFAADPYVSEGFMKTEIHEYHLVAGKFQLDLESNSLEQSVMVLLRRGNKWREERNSSAAIGSAITDFAKQQFSARKLAFAALFSDKNNNDSNRLAVMIFRGKDMDAVKTLAESLPLVAEEVISFDTFPQYLAKNALGN